MDDPITGAKGSARKGEPPAQRTGGPKRSLLGQPGLPGLGPGDFSSPHLCTNAYVQTLNRHRLGIGPIFDTAECGSRIGLAGCSL